MNETMSIAMDRGSLAKFDLHCPWIQECRVDTDFHYPEQSRNGEFLPTVYAHRQIVGKSFNNLDSLGMHLTWYKHSHDKIE